MKGQLGRIRKLSLTGYIIVVAILVLAGYDFWLRSQRSPFIAADSARIKGSPQASLKIIEYLDFQCQECARGFFILSRYLKKFPEDIYLEIRYFPALGGNSSGPLISSVFAQCASRQEKFWEYHDLLFERQVQWMKYGDVRPFLKVLAKEAGLDMPELEACANSSEARETVFREHAYGESLFIKSTPTYFVNGAMIVGVESFQSKLESHFNKSKKNE